MAFVLFLAVMFDLVIPSVGSRLLLGKEWSVILDILLISVHV